MKYTLTMIMAISSMTIFSSCGPTSSNYDRGRHEYRNTPRVTALSNGHYSVSLGGGKIGTFNKYGSVLSQANMSSSDLREARLAIIRHRREESDSDRHSPPGGFRGDYDAPVVRPRSDGKLEVQLSSGGVVLYSRHGNMIQKGSTVSGGDLYRANRAVQTYLREQ